MAVKRKTWKDDFSVWFREAINESILDYRYPVKGCGVWLPYGFKLRKKILKIMRRLLDETGHEEVLMPLLIPEDLLAQESDHIIGFENETYWVTHGGSTKLNVKLALRPTSETVVTPMVKLWVRSHADLPKKIYQIGSIFRYETKATRPLIRVREVTTFKEAHTFHSVHNEAVDQFNTAIRVYKAIFDQLCLPYLMSERPDWDRFAGAEKSCAFDTIFPDGRTLQIGTVHDLGQNFAKAFDFTFETEKGEKDHVWQTCYGISERIVAAVIVLHGDDHGLVIPPIIAPIQIVVIPIPYKGVEERINQECARVKRLLESKGFSVKLDDRENITPGSKFYYWERRGVPIRLEIGPKDLENNVATLVRRDSLHRTTTAITDLLDSIRKMIDDMTENMKERAWRWFRSQIYMVESIEEAKNIIESSKGVVELSWCGEKECGVKLETMIDARILGWPMEPEKNVSNICPVCRKEGKYTVRVARAY